jgi:hypothetical protein
MFIFSFVSKKTAYSRKQSPAAERDRESRQDVTSRHGGGGLEEEIVGRA